MVAMLRDPSNAINAIQDLVEHQTKRAAVRISTFRENDDFTECHRYLIYLYVRQRQYHPHWKILEFSRVIYYGIYGLK